MRPKSTTHLSRLMEEQNKLSSDNLQPSFKLQKIGNAAIHALGNVTEANPAIAKESGLFIQIFDKATRKDPKMEFVKTSQH